LLDQKLVRIVGRQEVPGRPILYGTSKLFLQRFGLRNLRDLPPLKEFQALGNPESFDLPFDVEPVTEGAKGSMADLSA
jgi:segregation and condensation protein B